MPYVIYLPKPILSTSKVLVYYSDTWILIFNIHYCNIKLNFNQIKFFINIHFICLKMNYMTYCIILYVRSQVKITKKHAFLRKFYIFWENSTFFERILHFLRKFLLTCGCINILSKDKSLFGDCSDQYMLNAKRAFDVDPPGNS